MARDLPPPPLLLQSASAEASEPAEDAFAGPASSSNHAAPDSGKQPQTPVSQRAAKMYKLELPTFSGPLEPAAINAWLERCGDVFFAWSSFSGATAVSPQLRIALAGMKLEEPSARTWWINNQHSLVLLPSSNLFVALFQERFIPLGSRLETLAKLYTITEGNLSFQDFVKLILQNVSASDDASDDDDD